MGQEREENKVTEISKNNDKTTKQNKRSRGRSGRNNKEKVCTGKPKIGTMNDPSWYVPNEQILRDASSIPFNTAVGNQINHVSHYPGKLWGMIDGSTQDGFVTAKSDQFIPGLWSMNVMIGPGHSKDNNSAVNVAARNIYSFVRYANSGHANYDSPDLMQYLLAMDSIYSYYAFLQRLYGVMNVYSTMNRYLPEALVRSMGVDFDDIHMNLANLRFYINQLAVKINSLYAPATLPLMVRHSWLFSNIFMDEPNSRAQLYIFNPEGFYVYDETLTKGQLKFEFLRGTNNKTFADLVSFGDKMVNAVALSESFGIMGGDIKKAYTSLMTVSLVPEAYSVVPVYNPEVLTQIEHAYALCSANDAPMAIREHDITSDPDTNALIYDPYFQSSYTRDGHLDDKIITFDKDDVTPADVMVATRLLPTFETESYNDTDKQVKVTFDEFGTEICTSFQIYTFANVEGKKKLCFNRFATNIYTGDTEHAGTYAIAALNIMRLASQFNHHPILYLRTNGDAVNSAVGNIGAFAQLGNVTTIDETTLSKMHATAVLGEYGVPVGSKEK